MVLLTAAPAVAIGVASLVPTDPVSGEVAAGRAEAGGQVRGEPFTLSVECATCHSESPGASAMRSATGDDVSPYGLWQATMMGNSFRDPYFHAQLQKESLKQGEHVQELCLRCHAPMGHHHAVMSGEDPPRLEDLLDDPFSEDSVSCTMCHQITAEGLGEERTFSGRPIVGTERKIFGPFADPAQGPMQSHVNYTPVQADHIKSSALCGSCHTLTTHHQGVAFPEQAPYLEWRNSEFSDENGASATSKTCQECHMARTGATRIARNPMGVDFLIPVREDYAAHGFVGGNAFMLDLFQFHRTELGIQADEDALARMAAATRRQLREDTATLEIENLRVTEGHLDWSVKVRNLTGHKFPTGYPARRAFLRVQVRRGRRVLFDCGAFDRDGRLVGVENELAIPHVDRVESPEDVVVYEMIAADPEGAPTTYLTQMVERKKDNRLLPRGWRDDGPHVDATAPAGVEGDDDFGAGGDTVDFHVPIDGDASGVRVLVWLHYQSVPPAWVDALRDVDAEACRKFVAMYDGMSKLPETVDVVSAFVR